MTPRSDRPRIDDVPPRPAVARRESALARRGTILVVDDEDPVREIVAEILAEAGFSVLAAASGPEALTVLEHSAPIDLLFTDIRMPEMDGFALAAEAQRQRPELKVLFTTGYTVRRPSPEMTVLQKPYRTQQLVAAVSVALGIRSRDTAHRGQRA